MVGFVSSRLFTEAILVALGGGAVGFWASSGLLRRLADWQPFGNFPMHTPVNADARMYCLALLLTLLSGFLFGAAPVGQVFRTSPFEVVKAGSTARTGKWFSARDALLVVQIMICAVLVTSSLVAVRGLMRSLHGHFGFDPDHSMLVDLRMAGFSGDQNGSTPRRMLDAIEAIPGLDSAALTDALLLSDTNATNIFSETTTDLRASHAAAAPYTFHVSPAYLRAEGTALVAGGSFTQNDDQNSPGVAVVNREFARKLFGSETAAIGRHFKMSDGTRVEVVGVADDGKYSSLTEDPHPAMFLALAQWPSGIQWMMVRSRRDPQQLSTEIRRPFYQVDAGLPVQVENRYDEMVTVLFGPKMATFALGILGLMGALLSITGIFGMAAYSVSKRMRELGIRVALGAQRSRVLGSALGRALRLLGVGAAAGLLFGMLASRVLAAVVYQATPRDPLVLAGAVLTMALVGILASWIPAQRAPPSIPQSSCARNEPLESPPCPGIVVNFRLVGGSDIARIRRPLFPLRATCGQSGYSIIFRTQLTPNLLGIAAHLR